MATNTVTVIGNLVEDPELRFTPSGIAMAKIRVAVNRRWRDQAGEWQEQTSFFGGTLWREAAENAAE
ncbi:MAG TPA: single-stranded DNA-binding protein, partial [Actinobacteria bacterium]|nr:single-stranded DNA-binding protein [Actinomycetota bacterium]